MKGKLSDMEVDLVHRSDDGKDSDRGRAPEPGPGQSQCTAGDALGAPAHAAAGTKQKITDMVSAGGLLPADRGYWTYVGSEVTPPCTEGVRWFVFEEDLSMSRDQMRAFTSSLQDEHAAHQDPHGRKIEANE